jgi:H+/gluconate symporter-like permease
MLDVSSAPASSGTAGVLAAAAENHVALLAIWSVMETIISVAGLACVLLLSLVV